MKWLAVLKPLPWLSESAKRQILKQIQSATMSGSRLPHWPSCECWSDAN